MEVNTSNSTISPTFSPNSTSNLHISHIGNVFNAEYKPTSEKFQQTTTLKNDIQNNGKADLIEVKIERGVKITKKAKQYKCNVCKKCFLSKEGLKQHRWLHTGDKRYKCDTCSERFTHMSSLKSHEYKHKDDIFKCHICERILGNPRYLKQHLKGVHGIGVQPPERKTTKIVKSVKCNMCNKIFSSKNNLKQHSWLHTGEKRYKCGTCSESFTHMSSLVVHEYKHTGEIFRCEICDRVLSCPFKLKYHLENIHGFTPAYKPKTFNPQNRGSPTNHQCKECLKCFSSDPYLKHHMRIHSGEKPYECKECGESFPYNSALKAHQLSKHNKIIHVCHICDKIVHNLKTLENHMSEEHSMSYKIICGELQKITNIDRSNPPKCSDCDLDLYYIKTLEQYRRTICKTLYKCEGCHKSYTYFEYSNKVLQQISKYGGIKASESKKITEKESSNKADNESTTHFDSIEPVRFKREGCKTEFSSSSNKDNHNQVEVEKQLSEAKITNRCKICQKTFASATTLKNHMLIHTGEKPYECEECNEKFTFISALYKHVFLLHGKKLRQKNKRRGKLLIEEPRCQVCKKVFASPNILKQHMRFHTGKKPYECEECSQSFTFKASLKAHHISKHYSKYRCEFCDIILYSKDSLQNHMYTKHDVSYESEQDAEDVSDGLKPLHCKNCNRTLLFVTTLRHNNRNNMCKTLYKCQGCNKSFTFIEKTPTNHVNTNESTVDVFPDDSTNAQSNTGNTYGVVVIEPLDTSFKEVENLCKDYKDRNSSSAIPLSKELPQTYDCFKCAICFSTSAELFYHIRTHKADNEFDCVMCKEIFETSEILKSHVQTVCTKNNKCVSEKYMELVKTPAKEMVEVYDVKHDNEETIVKVRQFSVVVNIVDSPERWNESTKEKQLVISTPRKHKVDGLEDIQDHDNNEVNVKQCPVVNKLDVGNAIEIRPDIHINDVVDVKQDHENSLVTFKQCSVMVNQINVENNICDYDNHKMFEDRQSNNPQADNDGDDVNIDYKYDDLRNSSDHHLMQNKLSVGTAVEIGNNVNEDNIGVCEESGSNNILSCDSESDDNIDDNYCDHSDSELMEVHFPKFDASQNSNRKNESGLTRDSPLSQHINFSVFNGEGSDDLLMTGLDKSNVGNKIKTARDITVVENKNASLKVDRSLNTQVNIINEKVTNHHNSSILTNVDGKNPEHLDIDKGRSFQNQDDVIQIDAVKKYQFRCEQCTKSFHDEYALKVHMRKHRRLNKYKTAFKAPYECDICKHKFKSLYNFKIHQRLHTGDRPYKCLYCLWRFTDYRSVAKHISFTHTNIEYRCERCEMNINGLNRFKMHLRQMHNWLAMEILKFVREGNTVLNNSKTMSNKTCDELKVEAGCPNINSKVGVPSEDDTNCTNYCCEVCGIKYRSRVGLCIHLNRKHKSSKDIICLKCGKLFENETELSLHSNEKHTENRSCKICKKVFSSKIGLKIHTSIHSGEKPFKCTICHRSFRYLSILNFHSKTHENASSYICNLCNKKYTNILSYDTHLRIAHKLFKRKKKSRIDRKVEFTCDVCKKIFKSQTALHSHMRIHVINKPFHCKECNKGFYHASSYKQHVFMHSKVRYNCKFCRANYKYANSLLKHELKSHKNEMERKSMEDSNQTVVKIEKEDGSALFPKNDIHFRKDRKVNTLNRTCNQETTKCEEDFNDLVKECVKLMNTDTTVYHCPRCGFKLFTPPGLMKHIQLHKDKHYNCVVCQSHFESSTDLKSHVIKHKLTHNSNSKLTFAACALCAIEFSDTEILSRLKMHVRTHKPEQLFKCSLCDLQFKCLSSVKSHFLGYHSDKEFNCQFCKAKYSKPGSLRNHLRKIHQLKCFISGSGKVVIKEKNPKQYTGIPTPRDYSDQSTDTATNDSVELSVNGFSVIYPGNLESEVMKVAVCDLDKPTDDVRKVYRNLSNESVSVTKNSSSISIGGADIVSSVSPRITRKELDRSMEVDVHVPTESSDASETVSSKYVVDRTKLPDTISESESNNLIEISESLVSPTKPTTPHPNSAEDSDIIRRGPQAIHKDINKVDAENTLNSTSIKQAETQYKFIAVDTTLEVDKLKEIALENVKYSRVQISLVDIGSTGDCRLKMKDKNKISNTEICSDSVYQNFQNESAVAYNNIQAPISNTIMRGEKDIENTNSNTNDNNTSKCEICTEIVQNLELHLKSHICIRGKNDDYKCKVCLLVFEQSSSLEIHMNLHKEINGKFNCVACRKKYKSASYTNAHMKSHTMEETFRCLICNKIFPGNTQLDLHVFTHITHTTFKCECCNKVFQNSKQLQNHLRRKMLISNRCSVCRREFMNKDMLERHDCAGNFTPKCHECNVCGKKLSSLATLKQHNRATHLKLEPYKCSVCDLKFTYKTSLTSHMDRHLHPDGLKCEICQKTFANKNSLTNHVKAVHYSTKTRKKARKFKPEDYIYKCDYENCNKAYTDTSGLLVHRRLHTGEKPYECKQCGEKFLYYPTYTNHVNSHLGVKYQCPDCGQILTSMPGLNAHMNIIHKGIKRKKKTEKVKCTVCDKLFPTTYYEKHMLIHEGKLQFTCKECGKSFSTNTILTSHKRSHLPNDKRPFQCSVCSRGFNSKFRLGEHTRIHTGEKNLKCDICNRAFAQATVLKNHMRTHTGEKPWKCKVCGKSFSCHGSLYTHRIIHTGQRPYSCTICDKKFKDRSARRMHIKTHNKTNK